MTARLKRLSEIYRRIDAKLRDEEDRRFPDDIELARLRAMKLRVKDQILQTRPAT